jgi:hypothetical protein
MTTEEQLDRLRAEMNTLLWVTRRAPVTPGTTAHPSMPEAWRICQVAMDRAGLATEPELRVELLREGFMDVIALCLHVNHIRGTDMAYVLDVCEKALGLEEK